MSAPIRKSLTFWERLAEPQSVISFLFLYCAIHFLVRAVITPNFTLDESEQMLFSQTLQWGYRFRHPPLITWLSWASLAGTGGSRTAFLLLKYVLMALGLMAYFGAARIVIRDTLYAALATFSLLATFSMGYLPVIDLMHTVLLATMLAAYMWADARVVTRGTWLDHLVLGVVTGLGLVSKYVFLIMPIALGIGVALTPLFRARLKPLRLLLAGIVAAAIVAPYAMWAHAHDYSLLALTQSVTKGAGPTFNPIGWAEGIGNLVIAMVSFVLPAALVFPLLYWRACKRLDEGQGDTEDRAWLRTYEIALITGAGIMLCAVFFVGAESFKARWLHQVMLLLPVYAFLRVKIAGATDRANKLFIAFAVVFVLAVIGTRVAIYETHVENCKECREYWPMSTYADGIRQAGFRDGTILGATYDLAGNLRYQFPHSRVVTPGYAPSVFGPDLGGQCLVVWEGEKDPPKETVDYLETALHAKVTSASMRGDVMAKLLMSKKRFDSMSYILLPPGVCHY
jgi:4-amino-4-deoxy-L-arabinose transferase-like glycosyltransferase